MQRSLTRIVASRLSLRPLALTIMLLSITGVSANEYTMESRMMSTMESPVTRHGNIAYESAVQWGRDTNFNSQNTVAPGWQLNATAIGNLINVQMAGAGNTVVINAMQVNQGMQQANIYVGTNRAKSSGEVADATNQKNRDEAIKGYVASTK